MVEKRLPGKVEGGTSDAKQTVARQMAEMTGLNPVEAAIKEITRITKSEIPKEWGPMASLFSCTEIFPDLAAQIFYALYTGKADRNSMHYPPAYLLSAAWADPEHLIGGVAIPALHDCVQQLGECAARTKGNAELSLEFTRKVMHDLILPYAIDIQKSNNPYARPLIAHGVFENGTQPLCLIFASILYHCSGPESFKRRLLDGISNAKARFLPDLPGATK